MRSILAIWALGGHSEGISQGGPRGTDRAPQGWGYSRPAHRTSAAPRTTHSSPYGASGARFAVRGLLLEQTGWLGGPGITHPVYPPVLPTRPAPYPVHHCRARTSLPYTYSGDTRFQEPEGEPRGIRTHPVSGPGTGYIQLYRILRFTRPFEGVLTEFSTCFTEFSARFTEVSTCFTEFY